MFYCYLIKCKTQKHVYISLTSGVHMLFVILAFKYRRIVGCPRNCKTFSGNIVQSLLAHGMRRCDNMWLDEYTKKTVEYYDGFMLIIGVRVETV